MNTASVYTSTGKEGEKVTLSKKLFGAEINPQLLAQAVRVYLGNQRAATAKTKTRSEVRGSTRKLFKQKGTGRARHGSVRAPIFVGGGVAHGPAGTQNYRRVLPKQMRSQALLAALSDRAAGKQVVILQDSGKYTGKTNQAAKVRGSLAKQVLVVSTGADVKFNRAWRNLAGVRLVNSEGLSAYDVLSCPQLVLTETALTKLASRYAA